MPNWEVNNMSHRIAKLYRRINNLNIFFEATISAFGMRIKVLGSNINPYFYANYSSWKLISLTTVPTFLLSML